MYEVLVNEEYKRVSKVLFIFPFFHQNNKHMYMYLQLFRSLFTSLYPFLMFILSLRSAETGEFERNLFSFTFQTCLSASVLPSSLVLAQQDAALIPATHAHCDILHCILGAIDK